MAKKRKTASSRLTVPHFSEIPAVKNVAELAKMKATPRRPLLIHFTAEQWRQASKGIRRGKARPKKGFRFVGIPDPDGGVVLRPECVPSGPDEECILRPVPRLGPPRIAFECYCRPTGSLIPGAEPAKPFCTMEVGFYPRLRFFCRKVLCVGNCRLQIVQSSAGMFPTFTLACVCVP